MKILVLGDAFTDRYLISSSTRLSAEAPIPIAKVSTLIDFPGGALNVRENLLALGVEAKYLFLPKQNYPIKHRLLIDGTQVARFDLNDWCKPYTLLDLYPLADANWDGVIVSDYGKGSVSEEVIQYLRELQIPIFVDTKNDPRIWIGSEALLFPNQLEFESFEESYSWFPNVILKRGSAGVSLLQYGKPVLSRPSKATYVSCVNGAGDTALAGFAVAKLSGARVEFCLEFAMASAGVAVERPYTYAPTIDEVTAKLAEL